VKILLLNGPNLDRLGSRQPEIYGTTTLKELIADLRTRAEAAGATLSDLQSPDAADLIDAIGATSPDAIIINPASLTHHDRALAVALGAFPGPVIEVHISNIQAREPYRRRSLIAPVATGSIVGLGVVGYRLALDAVLAAKPR
jgi:3-dehydroquinate dehydratase-2